ncbi:phosphoenolpyruvate carboxykinase (PEPCK) [Monocercomonoides exilis]|uniref:phosphoenolpyruvate carboxykinase (PEPCK) n=1 Tax=Monocercomonoides exilis TaxID=2049356 RepID=UPI00355A62CD|nr:phosphoenolpyruvate carboxykinase (PEPCK) [Monocercomonoides exilis]|eukprot:MONOS_15941.1-p1 / transcript=MONOS_15941.1 / gene=MONOS_15941 / organism=Monocercomonoides_exilis_PA203 / gene_product=phosphoenolpyruvate carboxykinase (PEPCK) / transcript_product=phosphoenolpyruvate carboxykinase (PEPCK) / location=Mono_scaffold01418:4393-6709(-) / protein_length=745 / sequence_SO=supercontig / SO=protein_coding / is_pseudo=false
MIPALPKCMLPLTWDSPSLGLAKEFIEYAVSVCKPDEVMVFDGRRESWIQSCEDLVKSGSFLKLNPYIWPNCYLSRSNPVDVARSEDRTFMCLKDGETLYRKPHNQIPPQLGFKWGCRAGEYDPEKKRELSTEEMRQCLLKRFEGCMVGRTMYVIPFSMGPVSSEFAKLGIQITDSLYVVANMYTMTHTGMGIISKIAEGSPFVPCWHSTGFPLEAGEKDVCWPCRLLPSDRYIAHFTQPDPAHPRLGEYSIMSYGSGYGGNAILGKKCYALRIASNMARRDKVKWMAEHMLILHVTYTPCIGIDEVTKKKKYGPAEYFTVTGAFPSACGKTNLAMLQVPKEFSDEWKVSCVGDDIAWIRFDSKGRMCAINPESGFFGVAPGTSDYTNRNAMETLRGGNTIFTNVGVTVEGDVWWDGLTEDPPKGLVDWRGHRMQDDAWRDEDKEKEKMKKKQFIKSAAHPNSRYTTPCAQCPIIDPEWNTGKGFPIDVMLFGGRRSQLMPLAVRTRDWNQGVLAAATLRSEGTAAVQDRVVGTLSFDPMAMRPFIGYNVGDYFNHWIEMGKMASDQYRPDIYVVNWFRKDAEGRFLWEGFSENFRIVRWACLQAKERREGKECASSSSCTPSSSSSCAASKCCGAETPLGYAPSPCALGLDLKSEESKHVLKDPSILSVCECKCEDGKCVVGKLLDDGWFNELKERKAFLELLEEDLGKELKKEFNELVDRFASAGMKAPAEMKIEDLHFQLE